MATTTIESRRDRVTLAEDAGLGRLSGISVLAGSGRSSVAMMWLATGTTRRCSRGVSAPV